MRFAKQVKGFDPVVESELIVFFYLVPEITAVFVLANVAWLAIFFILVCVWMERRAIHPTLNLGVLEQKVLLVDADPQANC